MMRLLSILPYSPPSPRLGGAELQMHGLHKGLQRLGVEVYVLADIRAVKSDFQVYEGLPIWGVRFPGLTSHPLRPGNIKIWTCWRDILRTVRKRIPRPDVIQVTTFRQPAMVGFLLARRLGVPWVVRIACSGSFGDFAFVRQNWLLRRLLPVMVGHVSRVVALEWITRDETIAAGCPAERVLVIPNAVEVRNQAIGTPP